MTAMLAIHDLHVSVEGKKILNGLTLEDSINMIVSGFCKEVFRELPMEFAVEAQKLLSVSLEGSVG